MYKLVAQYYKGGKKSRREMRSSARGRRPITSSSSLLCWVTLSTDLKKHVWEIGSFVSSASFKEWIVNAIVQSDSEIGRRERPQTKRTKKGRKERWANTFCTSSNDYKGEFQHRRVLVLVAQSVFVSLFLPKRKNSCRSSLVNDSSARQNHVINGALSVIPR